VTVHSSVGVRANFDTATFLVPPSAEEGLLVPSSMITCHVFKPASTLVYEGSGVQIGSLILSFLLLRMECH